MATKQETIKSLLKEKKAPFKANESILKENDIVTIRIAENAEFKTPKNSHYDADKAKELGSEYKTPERYLGVLIHIQRAGVEVEGTVEDEDGTKRCIIPWNQLISTRRTDLAVTDSELIAPYKGAKLVPNFQAVYDLVAGLSDSAYQALTGLPQGGPDITFVVKSAPCMVQQFLADRSSAKPELQEKSADGKKWKNGLFSKQTVYFA